MNENVLEGSIKKSLFKMAIPLFVLNLLNSLYGVVDTYFVGKIGELAVGAISLVHPIMWCSISIANGLSAGTIAIISTYVGAKNNEKASHFATEIVYFNVFFAIVLALGTYLLCDPILAYLKTPAEIYAGSKEYMMVIAFDYLGLFLINMFMAIRQACGDSKTGVVMSVIASILNVILDPIFIFGFHLGIKGAAIATVLSKLLVLPFLIKSLYSSETPSLNLKSFSTILYPIFMANLLPIQLPSIEAIAIEIAISQIILS